METMAKSAVAARKKKARKESKEKMKRRFGFTKRPKEEKKSTY